MKGKKLLSALIAGTMVLGSIGFTAFAEENPAGETESTVTENSGAPNPTAPQYSATFTGLQSAIDGNEDNKDSGDVIEAWTKDGVRYVKLNSDIAWAEDPDNTSASVDGLKIGSGYFNGYSEHAANVSIDMNGKTIEGGYRYQVSGGHGAIFKVFGATLSLENGTISGGSYTMGGGIYSSGGTVNLNNVNIKNCTAQTGAGIAITSGSQLTMIGGSICNNIAGRSCGGLWVVSGSTAYVKDTDISDNEALSYCGGVRVGGGGVASDSTVTLENVTVTNNVAKNYGGGFTIEATGSEVKLINSTVKDNHITNTKSNYSGGIYIEADTSLMLEGTNTISGNTKGEDENKVSSDFYIESAETVAGLENLETDVTVDCADGFYYDNTTKKIYESKTVINNTAESSGIKVELDKETLKQDLADNHGYDASSEAEYNVVINTISADDKKVVNDIADANADKAVVAYDIKVMKTENGKTEEVPVTNQKVTITLPTPINDSSEVAVYLIKDDSTYESVEDFDISEDGTQITFTATSFSGYTFVYNAVPLADSEIAEEIGVQFERVDDRNYNIVAYSTDDTKKINGLMTADLTFAFDENVTDDANANDDVYYTITPAANINLLENVYGTEGRYEFHFDGINAHNVTGERVVLGTVTFNGYCDNAKFEIVTTADTNVIHTTESANSIVDTFTNGAGLVYGTSAIENIVLDVPTYNLTIDVTFPNKVNDNAAAYQDMKIAIVGAHYNETINLGTEIPMTDGKYTVSRDLSSIDGANYTVTVSGAGYRTARYTVNLTTNKRLTFWNNVMTAEQAIESGSTVKTNTNFLAGDIVKDNNINIYDLSAVVSYFGENNLVSAHPEYAKYDLNRDGKIDSKDVAYVLVSWGK